jgi:hypothetical protein
VSEKKKPEDDDDDDTCFPKCGSESRLSLRRRRKEALDRYEEQRKKESSRVVDPDNLPDSVTKKSDSK